MKKSLLIILGVAAVLITAGTLFGSFMFAVYGEACTSPGEYACHDTYKDDLLKCGDDYKWHFEKYCAYNGEYTWCSSGVCTSTPISEPKPSLKEMPEAKCDDSDGGLNYETKGKVAYLGSTWKDWCVTENMVEEYYCSNGVVNTKRKFCDDVCVNGRCTTESGGEEALDYDCAKDAPGTSVEAPDKWCEDRFGSGWGCDWLTGKCVETKKEIEFSCSDTDGGVQRFIKGVVTINGEKKEDYCKDSSTVVEFFCNLRDKKLEIKELACDLPCSVGKCPLEEQPSFFNPYPAQGKDECGNQVCDGTLGETCESCPADCGQCTGGESGNKQSIGDTSLGLGEEPKIGEPVVKKDTTIKEDEKENVLPPESAGWAIIFFLTTTLLGGIIVILLLKRR